MAIYGSMALAALVRWPEVWLPGLLLAAAYVPFEIQTGTGTTLNIVVIGIAVLTVLWIAQMFLRREVRLAPAESNAPWIALLLVAGFSILAGGALWNPWVFTKNNFIIVQLAQWSIFILSGGAFWLTANAVAGRQVLRRLTQIVLFFGVLLLLRSIPVVSLASRFQLLDGPVFRIWVVALASALALFEPARPRWQRLALFAFAALFVLEMWRTGSSWQSGWLPPLVTVGVVMAVRLGRGLTRAAVISAVPGVLILVTVILPRLASSDDWSLGTRIVAWRGLVDLLRDRWLFGLGLASYWHYWRGIFGTMAYRDPRTGYMHITHDPTVNMHNNYMDILGQMGILGTLVFVWLCVAIYRDARRQFTAEPPGFGRAYVAACVGGFAGMLCAAMLADWIFPFVYNIGLRGFRDSYLGWMLLGGLVLLRRTRPEA